MNLLYKPDWEETKEHFLAWWAHEALDRCALAVTGLRSGITVEELPALPERIEDRWLDFEYLQKINDYGMRHTFYGAEAFPIWAPGYPGWASIPCFLGADVTLKEETGWVDPVIADGDLTSHTYTDIVIDPQNRWWCLAQELLRFSVEQARGKAIPTIGALGGCGDTLAALRSSNQLLFDVMDCPQYVSEFELYLMKQWTEVYDAFYEIIHEVSEGSTCWFPLWSPGKFYPAHNDFSYMISPKMFTEIFLPALEMQTQFLDHCVYHVDGIAAFAHVDALCDLPRLQALQILPGAGKPSPLYYMDVLKKVQARGKNLHITIPPEEVETALESLSARGLFIGTWCDTEENARTLIENCKKWSKDR